MMNGARIDQAAMSPPTAGPLIPPTRNPPAYRPLARPRCSLGTLTSSRVWALTPNIAEPSPPAPRRMMSSANEPENPARMLLTATIVMPTAITAGSPNLSTRRPAGSAPTMRIRANALTTPAAAAVMAVGITIVAGERRDVGGDDPEPERHGERDGGEDGHLARQAAEG